jgi:hypothetical protein
MYTLNDPFERVNELRRQADEHRLARQVRRRRRFGRSSWDEYE